MEPFVAWRESPLEVVKSGGRAPHWFPFAGMVAAPTSVDTRPQNLFGPREPLFMFTTEPVMTTLGFEWNPPMPLPTTVPVALTSLSPALASEQLSSSAVI